jgi:hypothetical protein
MPDATQEARLSLPPLSGVGFRLVLVGQALVGTRSHSRLALISR